jgi:SPP1 gp7 family putative phage head morphogenesis protein
MTAKEAKGQTPTAFKKASNRAKFIARNEVGTALGTINKERQLAADVNLYIWQTAEDERVRETHRALDQRIFSWQGEVVVEGTDYKMAVDPTFSSSGTIPGEPWNCRCVAIPYIPEFEEDEDD